MKYFLYKQEDQNLEDKSLDPPNLHKGCGCGGSHLQCLYIKVDREP